MRKLALLLASALIFTLAACGGKKETVKPPVEQAGLPKVQVLDSAGTQPEWVELGDTTGTFEGTKVIFFVGYGESKFKDTAKEAAQLNAATAAATSIKLIATKQVAKAWESIGAGDNETKEQVMKGLEAISARNVDVSGLRKTGTYWRQVSKPNIVNNQVSGWSQPQFEYYVRYAMDYSRFEQLRDGTIAQQKKETKLNDRQKKLYADMENKLNELDQAAGQ